MQSFLETLKNQNDAKNSTAASGVENLNQSFAADEMNDARKNTAAGGAENHNQSNVATDINLVNVNNVLNSLKIPDAIKDLPKYDGNPRLLFDFIKNVEEILPLMLSISSTPYANIILRAIRNKVTGDANEVLNMFGTPLDWSEIKGNLILHYSDKRNETSLIKDLHALKQGNESIEQFYSKIIEILSTLTNHTNIHERDSAIISSKTQLFSDMCLSTFLSGIKEPMGATIRAMKPKNLPEAFSFCIKEQNTFYMKYSMNKTSNPHKK